VFSPGGTNLNKDQRALGRGQNVDILVATPGRLIQHFEDTEGFIDRCQGVKVLILDEADRLLDMGFKRLDIASSRYSHRYCCLRELDRIMQYLAPKAAIAGVVRTRQTLLFSATYSPEMREVATRTMAPGYSVVNTVSEEEEQTHQHVDQSFIVVPVDKQPFELMATLMKHMQASDRCKAIVFFPTARQTGYMATLFNEAGLSVFEIHSRKSQVWLTVLQLMVRP
jgi:ATP-dependent RNA helicase MSS116